MTKCLDSTEWGRQMAALDEMIEGVACDFDALFQLRAIGGDLEELKFCVGALAKNVSNLKKKCAALKDPPDEPAT